MTHKITIGKYRLNLIDNVVVRKSVNSLAGTAEITLPGSAFNKVLEIESKINRGDQVRIELGYDIPTLEFAGFVQAININNSTITILCEDAIYKLRKALENKQYVNISLKELLLNLLKQMGSEYDLNCDYNFKYDKYVVNNATMFDVLKDIQKETRAYIYIVDNTIHVHPAESIVGPIQYYDWQINVESDSLKFMRAEDRRFEIEVQAFNAKGKRIIVKKGITGGDREVIKMQGVVDIKSMEKLAEVALSQHTYTGYEGSITGWLEPYCAPTWAVVLIDRQFPQREGKYFVKSTTVSFSQEGGKRTVELGIKLN